MKGKLIGMADAKLISDVTEEEMVAVMVDWARAHPKARWSDEYSDVTSMRELCIEALEAIGADGLGGCLLCQA